MVAFTNKGDPLKIAETNRIICNMEVIFFEKNMYIFVYNPADADKYEYICTCCC